MMILHTDSCGFINVERILTSVAVFVSTSSLAPVDRFAWVVRIFDQIAQIFPIRTGLRDLAPELGLRAVWDVEGFQECGLATLDGGEVSSAAVLNRDGSDKGRA